MKSYIVRFFSVLAVVMISLPALADNHATVDKSAPAIDPKAMQEMARLGTPGEGHKLLGKLVGSWDYTITFRMTPDMPESSSTGVAEHTLVMDGRFLEQSVEGPMDMGGETMMYKGHGYIGYDNRQEKYQTLWIDNMNTAMTAGVGEYDEATQTLIEKGEHYCAIQGKEVAYRSELKVVDDTHITHSVYQKLEDGSDFKMMEIAYTKK